MSGVPAAAWLFYERRAAIAELYPDLDPRDPARFVPRNIGARCDCALPSTSRAPRVLMATGHSIAKIERDSLHGANDAKRLRTTAA
jgi:hypothetical protein